MTNIGAIVWAYSGCFSGNQSMEHLAKARIRTTDVCSITFTFGDESPPFALLYYQSAVAAYQRKFPLTRGLCGRKDSGLHSLVLEFVVDDSQEFPSFRKSEEVNAVNIDVENDKSTAEVVVSPPTSPVMPHNSLLAARTAMMMIKEEFNLAENTMRGAQKAILRKRRKDALLAKNLKLVQELKEEEKKNSYVAATDENGQEIFPSNSEVSILLTNLSSKLDKLVDEFANNADQSDDLLQILEDFILMQENVNGILSNWTSNV